MGRLGAKQRLVLAPIPPEPSGTLPKAYSQLPWARNPREVGAKIWADSGPKPGLILAPTPPEPWGTLPKAHSHLPRARSPRGVGAEI